MEVREHCAGCGGTISRVTAEGLCPRCLLGLALDIPEDDTDQLSLPEPGERFGSYQIQRLLGQGGMGMVYLATQEERSGGKWP